MTLGGRFSGNLKFGSLAYGRGRAVGVRCDAHMLSLAEVLNVEIAGD
jgi:hypothetical protein